MQMGRLIIEINERRNVLMEKCADVLMKTDIGIHIASTHQHISTSAYQPELVYLITFYAAKPVIHFLIAFVVLVQMHSCSFTGQYSDRNHPHAPANR